MLLDMKFSSIKFSLSIPFIILILQGCATSGLSAIGQDYQKSLLTCQGHGYKLGTAAIDNCVALVTEQNNGLERKKICLQNAENASSTCNIRCKSLDKEIYSSCQNTCSANQQTAKAVCEDFHIIPNQKILSQQ